jgi:hypothetical protein
MGEKGNAYIVLVGNSEGKIQLRRPQHKLKNNIKMDFSEISLGGMG